MFTVDELEEEIKNIYDYKVGRKVLSRYTDNYPIKYNYHRQLLDDCDSVITDIPVDLENVRDMINNTVPVLSRLDYTLTIENKKIMVNGRKPIKELLRLIDEVDYACDLDMYERNLSKLNLATTYKIRVSAIPMDFINASENTTGWRSCFSIDGEYHCSTNAFYCDKRMLIATIEDSKGNKIGRRWLNIDYELKTVCVGKEYGTFGIYERNQLVKHIMTLIGVHDYNHFRQDDACCSDIDGCYLDSGYLVFYPLDNKDRYYSMYDNITEGLDSNDEVNDGIWNSGTICDCCGSRQHEDDMVWVDDEHLCISCLDNDYIYCDGLGEYVSNNTNFVRTRNGYIWCEEYALEHGCVLDGNEELIELDEAIWLDDLSEYYDINTIHYNYIEDLGIYVSMDYDDYMIYNGMCYSTKYYNENFKELEDEERN